MDLFSGTEDAVYRYVIPDFSNSMSYSFTIVIRCMLGFLRNLFRPLSEQGMLRIPSVAAKEPLVLWGYEGSPSVIRVKELLSSLELQYIYRYEVL